MFVGDRPEATESELSLCPVFVGDRLEAGLCLLSTSAA